MSRGKAATVPYKIKSSRVRQNMTQTELGGKVGLTQAQVTKIENGQTKLNVEMLSAIVEALGGTV
ncbi:helix-turn-helix transcriptional regulator [Weissella confusa]|uniref:helix-turn-helix domain-containing protein n=1 Tax=Weissella confusa TaxID=1583 RepID=UPI002FDAA8FA